MERRMPGGEYTTLSATSVQRRRRQRRLRLSLDLQKSGALVPPDVANEFD